MSQIDLFTGVTDNGRLQGTSGSAHVRLVSPLQESSFANPSTTGNTAVVAAQGAGVKIRVLGFIIVSTLAQTVKFQSATTDISPGWPVAANSGISTPFYPGGIFETAANEALNVNLSVATATGVQVVWEPVSV